MVCRREYNLDWKNRNIRHVRRYEKNYRSNKETKKKISDYFKMYYILNKKKLDRKNNKWRKDNPERARKLCRDYYYSKKLDFKKRRIALLSE
jgi:hypothetical protein